MKIDSITKSSERPMVFTILAIFFILQGIIHFYFGLISDTASFLGEINFSGFSAKIFYFSFVLIFIYLSYGLLKMSKSEWVFSMMMLWIIVIDRFLDLAGSDLFIGSLILFGYL